MIADLNVYRNNQFEPVEFSIDPNKILLSAWKKKNASDDLTISSADNVLSALEKLDCRSNIVTLKLYDINTTKMQFRYNSAEEFEDIKLSPDEYGNYIIESKRSSGMGTLKIQMDFDMNEFLPRIVAMSDIVSNVSSTSYCLNGHHLFQFVGTDFYAFFTTDYSSNYVKYPPLFTSTELTVNIQCFHGNIYVNPNPIVILSI